MTARVLGTQLVVRGVVLGLATLALYAWLAPSHIVDGDNAELSTLAVTGGAAHPSGYPLCVLWLRAMSWLPGSAAHAAALATAIVGALTVVVLHAACRAWGARPFAATAAVLVFATGPVVMRLSIEAEVFALNNLAVASVLWLAAAAGPARGLARAALLGLVAGLGLCDHLTCALVAPVGLLGVVRGVREARQPVAVVIAAAVGALAVGLLPYLYLLVAPSSAISWGHASSVGDLVGFFTRRDYGGIGSFSAEDGHVDPGANLAALGHTIGRGWLWLPALIGVATLAACAIRPGPGASGEPREPRAGWAMLAVSWLVAGPLLIARFNIAPVMIGRFICERFHILPLLLLAIPVAVGLDRLRRLRGRAVREPGPTLHAVLAIVGLVGAAALSLGEIQAVDSPAVEASARNMLRPLPPGAVVLVGADDLHYGAIYVQETLGERRDVVVILLPMLRLPWYRARVAARGVVLVPAAAGEDPSVDVARQVLALQRPLFIDLQQPHVRTAFPTYPIGNLFRVLPTGTAPPPIDAILDENRRAFASFDLDYPIPGRDDGFPTGVQGRYAETWSVLSRALAAAGHADEARAAAATAGALAPR